MIYFPIDLIPFYQSIMECVWLSTITAAKLQRFPQSSSLSLCSASPLLTLPSLLYADTLFSFLFLSSFFPPAPLLADVLTASTVAYGLEGKRTASFCFSAVLLQLVVIWKPRFFFFCCLFDRIEKQRLPSAFHPPLSYVYIT